MAHKTLLGGTSYDISGGKTLVNGTSYSIAGGKTLIGGAAYDISFGVDLAELFSGMTVSYVSGRNSSSSNVNMIATESYISDGSYKYAFSFDNGYMSIAKIRRSSDGQTFSAELLYQSNASDGNMKLYTNNGYLYNQRTFDSSTSGYYGSCLLWLYSRARPI